MARKLRVQYPDAVYQVMSRGDWREELAWEMRAQTTMPVGVDCSTLEDGDQRLLRAGFENHFSGSSRRQEAQISPSFGRDQSLLTSVATILKQALNLAALSLWKKPKMKICITMA